MNVVGRLLVVPKSNADKTFAALLQHANASMDLPGMQEKVTGSIESEIRGYARPLAH